jgi:ABC-type antimicrobial peptide transport system permease subunit
VVYARPSYFRVVGIPLLRGRDFDASDIARGSRVAIVSKAMAEVLWPGEDAMGKQLKTNDREAAAEVIGIVADPPGFVPATDHSYPGLLYLPESIGRAAEVIFHVRAPIGQAAIAAQVAEHLSRYKTRLVAPTPMTIDEYLDRSLLPQRIIARASGVIATIQLLLAVAGLSGLVAYVSALRRREIGIRTALGATRASVLRLVMRQGVRLTALGAAIGLGLSGLVAQAIGDTLPMSRGVVAGGLAFAAAVFAIVGAIAMLLPARRALSVTPAEALRVD